MNKDQLSKPQKGEEIAVLKTTMGDIKIRFFENCAPKAVENFVTHAKNGYYNNQKFHRVIKDFMIQGGDPLGNGTGGESIWGGSFEDEFSVEYRNYRGALSMANSGENTNGSQFFIVQLGEVSKDFLEQMTESGESYFPANVVENYKKIGGTPWLDFKHTVFGQVFDGMDIVDKIACAPADRRDRPIEDIKIINVSIEKY